MAVDFLVEIDPKDFKKFSRAIEKNILKTNEGAAQQLGKRGVGLLEDLTSTWKHSVDFNVEVEGNRDGIAVLIGTDDKVFKFLDEGTKVRRAVMSTNFKAKTKTGSLQSGAGRGGVVFISKKISLPGIKARKFSKQVVDKLEQEAEQIFNKALKRVR